MHQRHVNRSPESLRGDDLRVQGGSGMSQLQERSGVISSSHGDEETGVDVDAHVGGVVLQCESVVCVWADVGECGRWRGGGRRGGGGSREVCESEAASIDAHVQQGGHQHHAGTEWHQQRHSRLQRADHQLVHEPQLPAAEHPCRLRRVRVRPPAGLARVPAHQVQRLLGHGRRAAARRRERCVRVRQFLRVPVARRLCRCRPMLLRATLNFFAYTSCFSFPLNLIHRVFPRQCPN